MFFATVRFTVAKNPDKCPNLRTVGNYMSNCRKKRTSQKKTINPKWASNADEHPEENEGENACVFLGLNLRNHTSI